MELPEAGVAQRLWVGASPDTNPIPAAHLCWAGWVSPGTIPLSGVPGSQHCLRSGCCLPITLCTWAGAGPCPEHPAEHKEGINVGDWELTSSLPRAVISSAARCHRAPCSSWSEDGGQRQLLFCPGFNSCRAVVSLFCLETITLTHVSGVSLLKALAQSALQSQEPPHRPQPALPHDTFLSGARSPLG